MSSYLQGPSFIPTTLWQPDWNSIQQSLAMKQQKYNQGFDQVKAIESSLFNAKLTNNQNIEDRDKYIQQANKQLQNLADADLSLDTNVEASKGVFQPFLQDKALQMDMAVTKNADQEMNKALALRDSTDPAKRNEYWDVGVQYIQNGLDSLRTADKTDAKAYNKVASRRYVPAFDANKYLEDQAKKSGLEIVYDSSNNGRIVSIKNGKGTEMNYNDWAITQLSTNPQFRDAQMVVGTVSYENKAKNIIEHAASVGIHLDQTQINRKLAEEVYQDQHSALQKHFDSYNSTLKDLDAKLESFKSAPIKMVYQDGKKVPDPSDDTLLKIQNLEEQKQQYKQQSDDTFSKIKDLENHKDDLENKVFNNGSGYFAEQYASTISQNWATSYARTHYKKSISNDTAWQADRNRQFQYELHKMDNEADLQKARENNETKLAAKAMGKNKTGQTVDKNGNVITDEGRIIGIDPFNQQHIDPYEQRKQQLNTEKIKGGLRYSDGLSQLLPVSNLHIGDQKLDYATTTELTNQLNYLDENGYKSFNDKFSDGRNATVLGRTVNLLKSKGYKVSFNNPQEIREALSDLATKSVDQSHLTPDQMAKYNDGKAALADGNNILDAVYSKIKDTDDLLGKYINSPEAQKKYGKILVDNGKGGKEVIPTQKLASHLVGFYAEGKKYSPEMLAEAYKNGELKITQNASTQNYDPQTAGLRMAPSYFGDNYTVSIGDKRINISGKTAEAGKRLLSLINQFGKSEDFNKLAKSINKEAFTGTVYNLQDGESGQIVSYATGKKNPQNNAKVEAILGNIGNLDGFVDSKGNPLEKNGDYSDLLSNMSSSDVESFNYGAGRTGYFQLNPAAIKRLTKQGYGDEVAQLQNGSVRFKIGENTTAEALQDLPVAQKASLDRRLLEGKPVTQSPEMEADGFKYSIIPDNAGSKGTPNNVQVVVEIGKEPPLNIGTFNLTQYPFENIREILNNKYRDYLNASTQQYASTYSQAGPAGTMTYAEIQKLKQ